MVSAILTSLGLKATKERKKSNPIARTQMRRWIVKARRKAAKKAPLKIEMSISTRLVPSSSGLLRNTAELGEIMCSKTANAKATT